MPTWEIRVGDARTELAKMAAGSVQVCVTSPPYFGLRAYGTSPQVWDGDGSCGDEHEWSETVTPPRHSDNGVDGSTLQGGKTTQHVAQRTPTFAATCLRCGAWRGELGAEPTVALYVAHLVEVMRGVKRALRDDGVLFLNLGDSYAGGGGYSPGSPSNVKRQAALAGGDRQDGLFSVAGEHNYLARQRDRNAESIPPKNLYGVPWRVAFALRDDGWTLRSAMCWAKKNAMPESCRDRPGTSLEYIFMFSKRATYYWDAIAVARPSASFVPPIRSEDGNQDLPWLSTATPVDGVLPKEERSARSEMSSVLCCSDEELAANRQGTSDNAEDERQLSSERTRQGKTGRIPTVGSGQVVPAQVRAVGERSGVDIAQQRDCYSKDEAQSVLPFWQGQAHQPSLPTDGEGQGVPSAWNPQTTVTDEGGKHADGIGVDGDQDGSRQFVRVLRQDGSTANEGSRYSDLEGRTTHGGQHRAGVPFVQFSEGKQAATGRRTYEGFNARWDASEATGATAATRNLRNGDFFYDSLGVLIEQQRAYLSHLEHVRDHGGLLLDEDGDPLALDVNPHPWKEAHFATFPPKLVEPLIKAATSERGACAECGAPHRRVLERGADVPCGPERKRADAPGAVLSGSSAFRRGAYASYGTVGWKPTCNCGADVVPCVVLDLFAGSGTTLSVALKLGRDAVGIDLNNEYADMTRKRIADEVGAMFAHDVSPTEVATERRRKTT